jgi:pterin-4a-carbinolamine dehydratase
MTTNEVTHEMTAEEQEMAKIRRIPPKEFLERLKAERVQLVAKRLQLMPGWQLTKGDKAISRVYTFPEPRVAAAYAAYVTEHSTAMKLPASVLLSGSRAVVTLRGERREGIREVTDRVLELAAALG